MFCWLCWAGSAGCVVLVLLGWLCWADCVLLLVFSWLRWTGCAGYAAVGLIVLCWLFCCTGCVVLVVFSWLCSAGCVVLQLCWLCCPWADRGADMSFVCLDTVRAIAGEKRN